jgi:hypothetical protein
MLCPELPGGILRASTEDADGIAPEGRVELVHRSPGPFPSLSVEMPLGPVAGWFRQQFQ